jgi:type I restriction enzyme S subunit
MPSHWKLVRNKNIFQESKDVVGDKAEAYRLLSLTTKGIIYRDISSGKGKFPKEFNTYKIVKCGDMAFCLFDIDETPRTVGLSVFDGMLTGAYTIFHVNGINPQFAYYYYLALDNVKAMRPLYSGLRKTINVNTFLGTKFPLPPRTEQDQIVKFLDWKVSCINKLIHIKKKQIVLFREKLDAHISEVITHGINTSVEMKDSGIEWIKDIPKHWETIRCKFLFSERDERSEDGKEQHLSMSQKYGLIPDSQLDERRLLSESYKGGKLCYENDLVLNRLKAHLGVFSLSPQYGVISPDYTVLKPKSERILPSFAEIVLKSNKCRGELKTRVRGVVEGFWRLYTNDFNSIELPIPPIDEQKEIIANINFFKVNTKRCEDILIKEITLLNELKERVIADTVTGKIDVRDTIIPEHVCDDEYNIIYEDSKCEDENEDQNF